MSQRLIESFDGLTPAQLASVGKVASAGVGVVSTTGRTGDGVTGTAAMTQAQNTIRMRRISPHSAASGFQGFAVSLASAPAAEQKLWALLADDASVQLTVSIATNRTVKVYRGTLETGTLLGQSPTFFFDTGFRYLEVGYVLTGEGRIEVRSHPPATGSPPAAGTPRVLVVTGGTSSRAWAQAEFYLTEDIVIDDYYVNDVSGIAPNYFSGNLTIEISRPVSVRFQRSLFNLFPWIPNTGSDASATVDDTAFDGDVTYDYVRKELSAVGMNFSPLADDGRQINDVQLTAIARVVSSLEPFSPAVGMIRYDGSEFSVLQGVFDSTAWTGLYVMWVSTGGFGGSAPTIAQWNDCDPVFRS